MGFIGANVRVVDVRVAVLGELQLVVDGVDVTPHAPKERALVALLAIWRGHVIAADRLLDELWPDLPPGRGRRALQVRVAEIRRQLDRVGAASLLESVPPGYRLHLAAGALDADCFVALVGRGRVQADAGDTVGAATLFREALGLWRGEPLADAHQSSALEAEVARLAELRLDAIEERIAAELADGCHHRLVAELDGLACTHPMRERLWEQRVLALYRCGRQAEALRACAAIRRRLLEDLGVDPGVALRSLESDVLAQQPSLDWNPSTNARIVVPDPFDGIATATDRSTGNDPHAGVAFAGPPPEVRYVKTDDGVHLAYQVVGDGPLDLVIVPGYISELDNWWEAWSGRLVRRLAAFTRLILFDKRGVGLSDRPPHPGIEQWVEDLRTVLDAVGAEQPAILGMSAGGPIAVLFAATHPNRTGPLVLYGATPRALTDGIDYPSTLTAEALEQTLAMVEENWGTGNSLKIWCPSIAHDPEIRRQFGQYERRSASPGSATALLRTLCSIDVRHVLALIRTPTLVIHPARDRCSPVEQARYMADHIPGAVLSELDTADHLIWFSEAIDEITNQVLDFLVGATPAAEASRVLSTILVARREGADLSSAIAIIERYRGKVVAFLQPEELRAAFDGPARAVRCAAAIITEVASDHAPQVGVHTGECTRVGDTLVGSAMTLACQLAHLAVPGQVLVSQTVRDLVAGSSLELTDLGPCSLAPEIQHGHLHALLTT